MDNRTIEIDWDFRPTKRWIRFWINAQMNTLQHIGVTPGELIMKKRGKRGLHIWWHVSREKVLTEDEINMIQWILNDDVTRVRINRLRTRRGMKKMWNKLFSKVLWRKPLEALPVNCRKCRVIKCLKDLEAELEKQEDSGPELVHFIPGIDNAKTIQIRMGGK
jgi:hypothetical protein